MKLNMGTIDRRLRLFLVAPALIVIGVLAGPGGILAIVLYAVALVMIVTSLVGSCPLYTLFGIKTCPADRTDSGRGVTAAG